MQQKGERAALGTVTAVSSLRLVRTRIDVYNLDVVDSLAHGAAGLAAGSGATLLLMPLDYVKTTMQGARARLMQEA